MNSDQLKELERAVNKLKFKASQRASDLHDLVEDRLLLDWEQLPQVAQETYDACRLWSDKNKELKSAKS